MVDELGETQPTEPLKTSETPTPAEQFQTTVDALFDHYKTLPPTDEKVKKTYPQYSIIADGAGGEALFLTEPSDDGNGVRESISRSRDGKTIGWVHSEPVGSVSSGKAIIGEDRIIKREDDVKYISTTIIPQGNPDEQTWELSNPEHTDYVNLQVRMAISSLTPYLPQVSK